MLLLLPEEHAGLLDLAGGVRLTRLAYAHYAERAALGLPRTRTTTPDGFNMSVHQGVEPSMNAAGVAVRAEQIELLPDGYQLYRGRSRPVFTLMDTQTAELLMVALGELRPRGYEDVDAIAGFQSVCAQAAGTDALSRPGAGRVGVIGFGDYVRLHLAAFAAARPISEVWLHDPRHAAASAEREEFADRLSTEHDVPVRFVDETKELVQASEILLVCANSNEPVFDGTDLQPGTHVSFMTDTSEKLTATGPVQRLGRQLDDETVRRAALIVTPSKVQEERDRSASLRLPAERGVFSWDKVHELHEFFGASSTGRPARADSDISVLHNSAGWGVTMGAFLSATYEAACRSGAGTELSQVGGLEPLYQRPPSGFPS